MVDRTTKNQAQGRARQVKGWTKETAGRASGNGRLKASGRADRLDGKAQSTVADAGEQVKRVARKVTRR